MALLRRSTDGAPEFLRIAVARHAGQLNRYESVLQT